ncbi:A-kinase anchor protein 12 isoform X2 [Nannospalax galili]|uniref:A-kinase anchor protein 12 isoform X2 n=1 Tax=Nannospalax galili TaxID=1026970 RepID=UPI00111C27D5|nr:A-kinase anchor protein 12 isoform X2 [Nannospalax galili]
MAAAVNSRLFQGAPRSHLDPVGQRESEDVREKDRGKEMAANSAVEDITKDGQEEMPEIMEQIPASESTLEEMTQPTETQGNDVGFKKVFKFVGFKFTVKKDKNEKSDAVQLLTVKKEEGEGAEGSVGAGDHQEPSVESREPASKESELKESIEKPEDTLKQEQSGTEIPLQAKSTPPAEGEGKDEEEKQEKEPAKPPQSPTSPVTTETTSSFKKFFTHGWAGWRKKTSFKKPKEDELEASEKKKEQEPEEVDTEENEKMGGTSDQAPASELQPQEPAEVVDQARLSADYEKVELPLEDQVSGLQGPSEEKRAPLATEVFDKKTEVQQEVVAEVHVSTLEKMEEQEAGAMGETGEPMPTEKNEPPPEDEPVEEVVKPKEVCVSGGDHTQLMDLSPDEKVLTKHPEGIASEAEMLSSQERIKMQGSPLKKLFSSSGLKKLSGKKQKGKRGGGGDEEPGEHQHLQSESPESADEQKGDSSASSPEEPEEITCLEKGLADGQQEGEAEEGATSDGEKKREGITPWASFKKMVTPKKRVRRPSESDKEEEPDKVKSATLSSTESAASEIQEESKGVGDEQKPEEPKRKVDTSVSWEALICVGSSKKRARKASSSDDEVGPRTTGGDTHQVEDASKDKETGTDTIPAGSQEHDQGQQGSSSPEPAESPSEGEGVSTWESFKRLVTPRKKSKSKLEEKIEDSGVDHLASDVEPSKEESWVSIKKFIPGRRKKRSDGKQDQATAGDTGPMEINEEDSDVPAVVPLSEYDAVEREKMEVQRAQTSEETPLLQGAVYVSEELSKTLVHTVSVAVIDGTRAVTTAEERSPSWISASMTASPAQGEEATMPSTEEVAEREAIAEETPTVTQTLPESNDAQDDTVVSEVELTSEAVTTVETTEALGAEEVTEASGAEETTDMVSAVSQLTDSPDTTEEATPVQEVEGSVPDVEEQKRQTQAILQAVAEKVKEDSELPDASGQEDATQTVQRAGPRALEKVEEAEEDSEALDVEKEKDVGVGEPTKETDPEQFTQGSIVVKATPKSFEDVPEVAGVESRELVSTCQAEKPQQLMEQAMAPASAETLTDSETNGSTRVADPEAGGPTQQDEAMESWEDNAVVTCMQSQVAEAALTQKEEPPAPPSFQSQEGNKEQPRTEDALEPTQELSMEAVLVLSKTKVVQEASQFADEKAEDGLCVEGFEVSAHSTDGCDSQEKIAEVNFDGKVTDGAGGQKSESLTPEERKVETDVEREKARTKPEQAGEKQELETAAPTHEVLQQPVQTVAMPGSDQGKEVSSLEGSSSLIDQEEAGYTEVQVQSSDMPVTLTAVATKEVVETAKISETDESLKSAGTHLLPAETSSEKGDQWTPQPGEDTVPLGPKSQAESAPVMVSATHENTLHSDLEDKRSTSQKQRLDKEDERAGGPEDDGGTARETDLKAEAAISELETESSKLVQNIIQTAVDQFSSTEEKAPEACASDLQTQAPLMQADSQEAEQTLDKEESCHKASAQNETLTTPAQEASQPDAVEPVLSDFSKDVSEASEKMKVNEVESAIVNDQQFEEVIVPSEAEGDGNKVKPVPGDGRAKLGERVEKPPSESKDQKGDAAADPEYQKPVLAEADALGILTKESPDTNGPKLTDVQETGVQEGKMPSESNKELKLQTEEDPQKPERELAES